MRSIKVMKFSEANLEMLLTVEFNSNVEIPTVVLTQFKDNGFSVENFEERTGFKIVEID